MTGIEEEGKAIRGKSQRMAVSFSKEVIFELTYRNTLKGARKRHLARENSINKGCMKKMKHSGFMRTDEGNH